MKVQHNLIKSLSNWSAMIYWFSNLFIIESQIFQMNNEIVKNEMNE